MDSLTHLMAIRDQSAHAGAPPLRCYVISPRLGPIKCIASMVFFFFVIKLSKSVSYA